MVFVTVGNATQGFRRLLDAVDEAAGEGIFRNEQVFIQTGNNPDFHASHCQQQAFIDPDHYEALLNDASLIISHAGAGTLIKVLQTGKIPVVMARRAEHSEIIDDHQVELTQALAREGRVIAAFEVEDLPAAIIDERARKVRVRSVEPPALVALVAKAIEDLTKK